MRRLKVICRIDMVCRGAERVDEYRAEGYLLSDPPEVIAVIVERDNERGTTPYIWLGTFKSSDEAMNSLKDMLYNIGRREDRGFGCHEAVKG
ncbi:hypothetical protein D9Q81_08505 [Candidatus Korarchaeum cryptofilum]|jgi:hypothetical protein|uniref:Uncharacterized protein n=1 Tax=Candidatus Korarchaeum cryptofilum TaxID=498846 RepID=A0A3R9Q841_9CREN|nr:hypothetical protein [Candidatus Korarchaeum cryptofilum]MCC6029656.1 hypothetical protein [Candidatus Korarchaeum sp.]RSN67506.1 hypothetical protein D9Q81_08505 [Candidatus Korarchaeum cryptofilum]